MKNYHVRLQADVSKTFRATRAANSLDIDVEKKSIHELKITADLESPFNIGVIVGASGSGKTTLARQIFGEDCFREYLDASRPIIDQLPAGMSYDDCAAALNGIGLSQVPCWIRSAHTLSNGQRARAEALLAMLAATEAPTVIDEWTSVVDRTVGKAMSHTLQKYARANDKRIVLLSCHYDVLEWLNPDWIIDCNAATYVDRRSLRPARQEELSFDVREVGGETWRSFAKYHYLSDTLPGGRRYFYGLFHGENQIGFVCYSNYVPVRKEHRDKRMIMHFNRLVIHPDYVGFGLGLKFLNATAPMVAAMNHRVMGKFSSTPVFKALTKSPDWKLRDVSRPIGRNIGYIANCTLNRKHAIRSNLLIYSFEYAPRQQQPVATQIG